MSKSVGIVTEYNPFHTGHRYQIDFLHKKGYETIITAMSGSCVQRGLPSFLSKFERSQMAIENGVSLVCEIPYPFSCMSAEGYAMAGMQTLKAVGVDAVCFGSESADIDLLKNIAVFLLSDEYEHSLKNYLDKNIPFASAREKAIFDKFNLSSETLSASNDILAIEYIKACIRLDWQPEFIALRRKGAGYNQLEQQNGFASATGIRKMISEYRLDSVMNYIPKESQKTFVKNLDRGSYFIPDVSWEKAVLFTLRSKTSEDFSKIDDCNAELANSFEKAVSISYDMESLFKNLPTKRYTRSRLNRIILKSILGHNEGIPKDIKYIRFLGFDKKGEEHIRKISKSCPLPISHSSKILSAKSEECKNIVFAEAAACDMQSTFFKISGEPRTDFTTKIIKL